MSPIFTSKSSPGETSNQQSLPQESFQCTPSICNLSVSTSENTRSLEGTHALIQGAISLWMYWYTNVRYVEKWKKGNLGTVRYLATVSGVFDVKLPEHPPAEFLDVSWVQNVYAKTSRDLCSSTCLETCLTTQICSCSNRTIVDSSLF